MAGRDVAESDMEPKKEMRRSGFGHGWPYAAKAREGRERRAESDSMKKTNSVGREGRCRV